MPSRNMLHEPKQY